MAKRKEQRTNNDLQNTTQKTKDQTTRTPLKPGFVTRVTRTPLKPGFVTRVTRHVPLMEHELLTLDL
jgi:hypothetical protein